MHGFQAYTILKIWQSGSNFALVYTTMHEKPQMEILESCHNCPWQYFQSFDHRIVIVFVFMAPERVVLPASQNKWHQSCWHDVSRAALGLSFRKYKRKWKWPNLSIQLRRQCFINLWIQTALFLIIAIAATSAAVSWQFSGWISPIPFWLVISISTDYITALVYTMQSNILAGIINCVRYEL